MSTPKPPNSPTPDSEETRPDETSPPERDGFFRRVRRELKPKPVHPSEAEEIVIMPGQGEDGPSERS